MCLNQFIPKWALVWQSAIVPKSAKSCCTGTPLSQMATFRKPNQWSFRSFIYPSHCHGYKSLPWLLLVHELNRFQFAPRGQLGLDRFGPNQFWYKFKHANLFQTTPICVAWSVNTLLKVKEGLFSQIVLLFFYYVNCLMIPHFCWLMSLNVEVCSFFLLVEELLPRGRSG